jgi:hypothetical protein
MIHSLAFARAEKALNDAEDIDALEAAWSDHVDFPDESDEREYLLGIFHDKAAQFAIEAAKVLMAG